MGGPGGARSLEIDQRLLLDALQDAVVAAWEDGVIAYANQAVRELLGWDPAELVGRPLETIIPVELREAHRRGFQRYQRTGEGTIVGTPVQLPALHRAGYEVDAEVTLSGFHPNGRMLVVGSIRDVSRRMGLERETALARYLVQILAEATTLADAAPRILQAVCQEMEWDIGNLWVVDDAAEVLRCSETWHEPHVDAPEFEELTRRSIVKRGMWLPGLVWSEGEPQWSPDILQDDQLVRRDAAVAEGLRTGAAFPVVSGGEVVGVIEFFSRRYRQPEPWIVETLSTVGAPLGRLLERLREEEKLRFDKAMLELQQDAAIEGILVVSTFGTILSYNQRFLDMWGIPPEVVATGNDDDAVRYVMSQLVDPEAFAERVHYLYEHPDEESRDEIRLVDGRVFDRWSAPLAREEGGYYGRAWYFRDVTAREVVERQLEEARERAAYLASASEQLAASLDHATVIEKVADLTVPRLADWGLVFMEMDSEIEVVAVRHFDRATQELAQQVATQHPSWPGARAALVHTLRTREATLIADVGDDVIEVIGGGDHEQTELVRTLGLGSLMIVPMVARGRVIGGLVLATAESGRHYDQADLVLATDLAHRAALAIDNARLYGDRVDVARTLQASLLPPELPAVTGASLAVTYHAASDGLEVGGDFYDVFQTGRGDWAIVVGDVCGRGTEAASMTALVRHSVRATAVQTRSPSRILEVVNETMLRHGTSERFCTVAYARLQMTPQGGRVTLTCAGHPLPLVLRRQGRVEVTGIPGTALGLLPHPKLAEAGVQLAPGDTLVLFTDGLTEARTAGGMFGVESLVSVLEECRGLDPEAVVARILDAVDRARTAPARDDMAVLVIRLDHLPAQTGDRVAELELVADRSAPSQARRFVGQALAEWDHGHLRDSAMLLTSELVTNGVVHGQGPLRVTVSERGEEAVRIEVFDAATHGDITPQASALMSEHGRGLAIVDALASAWGCQRVASGKTVWFELAVPDGPPRKGDGAR